MFFSYAFSGATQRVSTKSSTANPGKSKYSVNTWKALRVVYKALFAIRFMTVTYQVLLSQPSLSTSFNPTNQMKLELKVLCMQWASTFFKIQDDRWISEVMTVWSWSKSVFFQVILQAWKIIGIWSNSLVLCISRLLLAWLCVPLTRTGSIHFQLAGLFDHSDNIMESLKQWFLVLI